MVGFLEDVQGARFEPLAGVMLALFDSRYEDAYEDLRPKCFLRMFVLQCRTGSCELEVFGAHVRLAMGEACVVSCSNDEVGRCTLRRSRDFSGSLLGFSRRDIPDSTRQTLRSFDVDLTTFERVAECGSFVRMLQPRHSLDHAYALLYAVPTRNAKGLVRLRTIELGYVLSRGAWKRSETERPHKPSHDEIARRAQEVMTRDLSHPLTIPATARLCGTSPTVLKQSFREAYGQSVHEWYRECRMRYAAQLLENTSYSVAQIALEVGYSNPSKFSKVFSQLMGCTPSLWRATHRALKSKEGSSCPNGVVRTGE